MNKKSFKFIALCIAFCVLFLGDTQKKDLALILPTPGDTVSYDQGKTILVSVSKDAGDHLLISTQWEADKLVDINTKTTKDNFAKEFYKIFEPRTSIELLSYSYKFYSGMSKPDSIIFSYSDTMTIRSFWQTTRFAEFLKEVQSINASSIFIKIRGWKDSIYTTTHEDPTSEGRALYTIPVQLIPDMNRIYFSIPGQSQNTVEYLTRFIVDSNPIDSRPERFHNSKLEQSCTPCHEGLPSSNPKQETNTDCGVCHKALISGKLVHGPAADSKECGTCHSWSSEKNAMVVTKGVPDVCYDCHDEKKKEIEDSKVPHPVANDCVSCHSPHGSNQPAILKKDVYRLCLSCHDNYKSNHPVDKHPLRSAKLSSQNNEEISCVSCHKPHGSENAALLKAGGGSMAICMQCHQK